MKIQSVCTALCAALLAALLAGCLVNDQGTVIGNPATPAPAQAQPQTTPGPTATPEPTPLPANWHQVDTSDPGSVTLAFTGDWNFADDWELMQSYTASGRDFAENFSPDLLALMQGADILVCNNEFSISDRGSPLPGKQYTFRAQPSSAALWHLAGADLVGLANNHCGDYGPDAFLDTLDNLSAAGVPYVGAGRDLAEAQQAQYFIANGMTFAFVAATRAEKNIMTPQATADGPGVLYTYDPEQTLDAIRTAAQNADFVTVYVHWGTENTTRLEQAQLDLATAYAEAGADLIVGAHPHVLQGAGWRGDVPVFYSLGNFWFNTDTVNTALLAVTVRAPGDFTCTVLPCQQAGGRTSLLTDETDRLWVLRTMNNAMENGYLADDGVLWQDGQ